jgi:hypothetical protein
MFDTCKNRALFASDELWRRRTRACVEATALLVCYAGAEFSLFGDVVRTLGDIGDSEKTHESWVAGRDTLFVLRWSFLSIMAIRRILSGNELIKEDARSTIGSFAALRTASGPEDEVAEKNAQEIEDTLINLWWVELRTFCQEHDFVNSKIILERCADQGLQISDLDLDGSLELVDSNISTLRERFHRSSHKITQQFPGVQFDVLGFGSGSSLDIDRFFDSLSTPLGFRFVYPWDIVKFFHQCDYNMLFNHLMNSRRTYTEEFLSWPQNLRNLLQRQLWRLQDLRDGGGLGFTVELFLVALHQLLSASPPQDSHSALYITTFRVITSD